MSVRDKASATGAAPTGGLYRALWRWHLYAGILVAPIVLVLAITGLVYLFDDELSAIIHRDLVEVAQTQDAQPVSAQQAAVLVTYPGARLLQYQAPASQTRSAIWKIVAADGKDLTVFVNPHTAQILGHIPAGQSLGEIMVKLHGELIIGPFGDYLVEFAACWTFVLLVTGVFLWWPRQSRRVGVAAPRLTAKGRAFWRDLHAVPSAWNAPVVAFLVLTGLPWSAFWGGTLASLGTTTSLAGVMAPTPNFHGAPIAPDPHAAHRGHNAHNGDLDLPWSIRNADRPTVQPVVRSISIDQVIGEAAARNMSGPTFKIFYPTATGEVFTLSHVPAKAEGQRTVYLNPADGAVVDDIPWSRYSPVGKVVEFGVQTHMGKQFGLANQLFMAASCVILAATIIFGLVMWWKRRPGTRFNQPGPGDGFKTPTPVVAVAIALGVAFPLVGLSMLLVIAIEISAARVRRRNP